LQSNFCKHRSEFKRGTNITLFTLDIIAKDGAYNFFIALDKLRRAIQYRCDERKRENYSRNKRSLLQTFRSFLLFFFVEIVRGIEGDSVRFRWLFGKKLPSFLPRVGE